MSDIAGDAASAAAGTSETVANSAVGGDQQANPVTENHGGQETNSDPPINPAWNKMLEGIPSSLHPMVTPHLRDWDKNFQTKLSEVQSQYAPFEAFKDTPPETLEQALNFYKVMEANPEAVYNQMAEFYGFGANGDQGQQVQESGDSDAPEFDLDSDDIMQNPKVQELLKNQETMAQYLVSQQQKEDQQRWEAEIDQEVSTIKEANPDFDEADETLMFQIAAASNTTLTEAANQVKAYNESRAQRNAAPKAPPVMGAGGFVPAVENVDPRKLDRNGTRNLVADLLTQAKQNG